MRHQQRRPAMTDPALCHIAQADRDDRTFGAKALGSRCWVRLNTSSLASLIGSHQPRPPWLMISTSPAPRRYFRHFGVLPSLSSSQPGCRRSNSAVQLTPARSWSSSVSCPLIAVFPPGMAGRSRSRTPLRPFSLLHLALIPSWHPPARATGQGRAQHGSALARQPLAAWPAAAVGPSRRFLVVVAAGDPPYASVAVRVAVPAGGRRRKRRPPHDTGRHKQGTITTYIG